MAWQFDHSQALNPAATITSIAFDGSDVWVSVNGRIEVYKLWHPYWNPYYTPQLSTTEIAGSASATVHSDSLNPLEAKYQQPYINISEFPFDPEVGRQAGPYTFITTPAAYSQMVAHLGHMYCQRQSDDTLIDVYTISTHSFVKTITIEDNQGKIAVGYGALWYSSPFIDGTVQQTMYRYDIASESVISNTIPGRPQISTRDIADGLDGSMFITSFNNHGIIRVNGTSGVMGGIIRVNRHPYRLYVEQDKTIYILSDNQGNNAQFGMVSAFNQATNTYVNTCGAIGWANDFVQYGGFGWLIGGFAKCARVNLTSKDTKLVDGTSPGAKLVGVGGSSTSIGLITPPITYDRWNGTSLETVTVEPHLVIASGSKVVFRPIRPLCRINSVSLLGTSMISLGDSDYYGD